MTAAVYIPMAKLLDVWGRAEGFALTVAFSTLGLILMAVSQNLATFCAAQVGLIIYHPGYPDFLRFLTAASQIFYAVGFSGIIYTICVLAADATNLRNRGLAFAFTSSPYMITAFAGSKAAEGFLLNVNWRWGFGAFAIILPIVASPLFAILKLNEKKAAKKGIFVKEKSGRTLSQNIWYCLVQFDGKSRTSNS